MILTDEISLKDIWNKGTILSFNFVHTWTYNFKYELFSVPQSLSVTREKLNTKIQQKTSKKKRKCRGFFAPYNRLEICWKGILNVSGSRLVFENKKIQIFSVISKIWIFDIFEISGTDSSVFFGSLKILKVHRRAL